MSVRFLFASGFISAVLTIKRPNLGSRLSVQGYLWIRIEAAPSPSTAQEKPSPDSSRLNSPATVRLMDLTRAAIGLPSLSNGSAQ
jgi:hypothetical protein